MFDGPIGEDGGAILINGSSGNLTITNCEFTSNQAGDQGGAIAIENGATGVIGTSSFIGNRAYDDGGAIYVADGTLTVNTSLFFENEASDSGGAIQIGEGSVTVNNSTFSGNLGNNGAGIRVTDDASLNLNSVTMTLNIASNRGGGIKVDDGGALIIANTIIGNNSANDGDDVQIDGSLTSNGYNIISIDDLGDYTPVGTDMEGADPLLGSLSDNGGPTLTHALLAGSPALDQGYPGCLATDQRLFIRNDGNCDVGAVESGAQPFAIPTMGTWGILVLCLLVLIGSVITLQSLKYEQRSTSDIKPAR